MAGLTVTACGKQILYRVMQDTTAGATSQNSPRGQLPYLKEDGQSWRDHADSCAHGRRSALVSIMEDTHG